MVFKEYYDTMGVLIATYWYSATRRDCKPFLILKIFIEQNKISTVFYFMDCVFLKELGSYCLV